MYKKPALGVYPRKMWLWEYGNGTIIPLKDVKERYEHVKERIIGRITNDDDLHDEWMIELEELRKYKEIFHFYPGHRHDDAGFDSGIGLFPLRAAWIIELQLS